MRALTVLALALLEVGSAVAGDDPAPLPTTEKAVAQVQAGREAAYLRVLSTFDAAAMADPGNPLPVVARCEFVGKFLDEEYGQWIDSAPAEFESCSRTLKARWPKSPDVQLFTLDQLGGKDAVGLGEKLLADSDSWSVAQRRRLLATLSESYEWQDDKQRAGELAVPASRLGELSRVPLAIEHLVSKQEFAKAERLLRESPAATDQWSATRRVTAALGLPAQRSALAELRRYRSATFTVDAAVAAKAHARAGDLKAARRVLARQPAKTPALQGARFDIALELHDWKAAAALIDMTDADRFATSFQQSALLVRQSPASMFSTNMLLAGFATLVLFAGLSLAPALFLAPVHYRGLVRRVRGTPSIPLFNGIGLRHAWLGGALALCVPLIATVLWEPSSLAILLEGEALPDSRALFRISLWSTLLSLVCLSPMLRRLGRDQFLGTAAVLGAWWRVLLSWVVVLCVSYLVSYWNLESGGAETLQTKAVEALISVGARDYSIAITFLLLAVLVPIVEELVFRGLLLGGMSRHISFGWANLAQALLFAAFHDDLPRFPFYFVMGLLAGWLVKRTGALSPAIVLHAAVNGVAVATRVFAT